MVRLMNGYSSILNGCLLLDLETTPDARVLKAGMVLGERTRLLKGRFGPAGLRSALDEMALGAKFVLGHNLIDHDLRVLREVVPGAVVHGLPVIDTLLLSPVAFPRNPYHHLVKDYRLLSTALNDPVSDARNAGALFRDELEVFERLALNDRGLLRFYAWAFSGVMGPFFETLGVEGFSGEEASSFFERRAGACGCRTAARFQAMDLAGMSGREASAYALAWMEVAGTGSIVPHWVRYRFPQVTEMVRRLRERGCGDSGCGYCVEHHDPERQLQRFFGFEAFRKVPCTEDGNSLQEAIVRKGMNDEPLLAILPTGGGKSLCFQLPALVRNLRSGVLSVVISPLQALMKDQVENMNRLTESSFAAALNGMLTPPERGDVLERVRMGDVALLYVSPEQVRNASFRSVVKQREIGCWIFDEAHCLSRWGHSFRPDYLYVSRFIRELAEQQGVVVPPVACFTATAKRDVVEEIRDHFRRELRQELALFDGGAERTNLDFEVQLVNAAEKSHRVKELLLERLPEKGLGSGVVYCATRRGAAELAEMLQRAGISAEAFHAGLPAPEKRRIQEAFLAGDVQHICATNAFGMGIDKDNVRLVIHADIPGSLENYLQEAGRAGRDRMRAQCVLLYDQQDTETQFALSAMSRLSRHDIAQILRGLRRAKQDDQQAVVITAGEILRDEEVDTEFDMSDTMASTKVSTAISMLERGQFVRRDENRTNVLQVQPLVRTMEEARERVNGLPLSEGVKRQWLDVLGRLFNTRPDEGVSADELAELPSMAVREERAEYSVLRHDTLPVMRILNDMVQARLIEKETLLSAYVMVRHRRASDRVLEHAVALERALIAVMQEEEPDAEGWLLLSLRRVNQRLLDEGFASAPESVRKVLCSLEQDGQGLAGHRGSLELKYRDKEHYRVKLRRSWEALNEIAEKRRALAGVILQTIMGKADASARGELLIKFSEKELREAVGRDMFLGPQIRDMGAAIERGLLYLHEQRAIILQQGLAIFRQAMRITILPEARGRRFTGGDYSSLREHYKERTFQIHVMNRYASLGLEKIRSALALVAGYFTMSRSEFVKSFFADEEKMLEHATGAESYQRIVDGLNNAVQASVVSAGINRNMLVLAGPGSGKTRVIAHRCAYLLRVERVRAREILVVCFNRAAAVSLRQRIRALAGRDAMGVTIQTYHGLAMRLIGASLSGRVEGEDEVPDLDAMIPRATAMLRGECDIPGLERDEMRERLLAGYRHILIDEYQDIDQPQYDMISALAGRTLEADVADARLSILAVGDDDQNVYTFRGANIRFIREFERDYQAHTYYLVENYRSTANIIGAANRLIRNNRDRMKSGHPIVINRERKGDSPGESVQLVVCRDELHQARFVLQAIAARREEKKGSVAVFARTREELHSVRAALAACDIPVVLGADKAGLPLHRTREASSLIGLLRGMKQKAVRAEEVREGFHAEACYAANNPWCRIVDRVLDEWQEESGGHRRMPQEVIDYVYEALHEQQRDAGAHDAVYLSTVHAAKGLEFEHVIMLGGWKNQTGRAQREEERRLYYVGMTRARETLSLCVLEQSNHPFAREVYGEGVRRIKAPWSDEPEEALLRRQYMLLGLADVWIDYPVAASSGATLRREIAKLRMGDTVQLKAVGERVYVLSTTGYRVGALSKTASAVWRRKLDEVIAARVYAIMERHRKPGEDERSPAEWEVPLLELAVCRNARLPWGTLNGS
jgi:ATP-dependent DNA helicase RecQ